MKQEDIQALTDSELDAVAQWAIDEIERRTAFVSPEAPEAPSLESDAPHVCVSCGTHHPFAPCPPGTLERIARETVERLQREG